MKADKSSVMRKLKIARGQMDGIYTNDRRRPLISINDIETVRKSL